MEYLVNRRFLDMRVPTYASMDFIKHISPDTIKVHIKGSQCSICLSSLDGLNFDIQNGCIVVKNQDVKVKITCLAPCDVFKLMIGWGVITPID
jgi:hypothetical protein